MKIHIYYYARPDLKDYHVTAALHRIPNVTVSNQWEDADLVICVDTGHILPPEPVVKEKSVFWCLHCHSTKHQRFASLFRKTFGADIHYVKDLLYDEWIPNGVGLHSFPELNPNPERTIPVGFLGQYFGARKTVLREIQAKLTEKGIPHQIIDSGANKTGRRGDGPGTVRPEWYSGDGFNRFIRSCKIWLNVTTNPELFLLNNRIFEGIATGTCVVSDIVEGCLDLIPNTHGVIYYQTFNADDAISKILYLLKNPHARQMIVSNGRQHIGTSSIASRIQQIIDRSTQ